MQARYFTQRGEEMASLLASTGCHEVAFGAESGSQTILNNVRAFVRDSGIHDFQCVVYMPFRGTQIRGMIDAGEPVDLSISPKGTDGDVTGAYGIKGGDSACEVRTTALSPDDLKGFRDYLVSTYRPQSHKTKWTNEDQFFDVAHFTTTATS